mgnify:CR=1 FL=1
MPVKKDFEVADKNLHDLKSFDCGKPGMNTFLAKNAVKHNKLGLSRTFVLPGTTPEITKAGQAPVAAYFTLTNSNVLRQEIPAEKSLPRYPIPVILLARLAVDSRYKGKGLGSKTLVYALRKAAALSKAGLPAFGVILDVLDDDALRFYQHFESFKPFTDDPMRLYISMKTVEQL